MNDGIITDIVLTVLSEKAQHSDHISSNSKLRDLGLNSITFIEMIIDLEIKLDIEYPDNMLFIDATENVEAFIQLLCVLVKRNTI